MRRTARGPRHTPPRHTRVGGGARAAGMPGFVREAIPAVLVVFLAAVAAVRHEPGVDIGGEGTAQSQTARRGSVPASGGSGGAQGAD